MKTNPKIRKPLGLKGSEQHHEPESQPGENGDPDHMDAKTGDATLAEKVAQTVRDSDAETQIAEQLRDLDRGPDGARK